MKSVQFSFVEAAGLSLEAPRPGVLKGTGFSPSVEK